MNFENIKSKMDAATMEDNPIPSKIKDLGASKMPIQMVRKTIRKEIITQLIAIVIFFAVPSFIELHQLPKAIYYMLMFVTAIITLGYLAKMTWFLNKTRILNNTSKDAIVDFIYDLKLTLEVYKTAIIAGSLLLPISLLALLLGSVHTKEELFTNLILLNLSTPMIIVYIVGYLIIALIIYFITIGWANSLYGVHIKALEETLEEFNI